MEAEAVLPPAAALEVPDSASATPEATGSSPVAESGAENGAATRLQKAYRGYRTRRKLADSAIVVEELWWQALEFAQLNHTTVSFFQEPKPETAASRWNRVTLNASKVGQGLSRDSKALKLAFQHWIEAQERENYEYLINEGKIVHKLSGELLDTSQENGTKWIFVMSTAKRLYAGKKEKGVFQHSSFLAGGATIAAGRFTAENGIIKSIWAYSGHYKPSSENLGNFMNFLEDNGVDLKVKVRSSTKEDYYDDPVPSDTQNLTAATSTPEVMNISERNEDENAPAKQAKPAYQRTISGGLQSPKSTEVPHHAILERMKSKGESKSYQLGHRLSLKWSTGAGPRIGCVKDYPMQLRTQVLEMVDLSPRGSTPSASKRLPPWFSPTSPTSALTSIASANLEA